MRRAPRCYDLGVSHRVEVEQVDARIVPVQGEVLEGSFFLRPSGSRSETLGARLNEPGVAFVPVQIRERSELLQLSWVAYLEIRTELREVAELEDLGAWRQQVLIRLASGTVLEGDLLYMLPPERRRISDLLNSDSTRFLLLVGDKLTRYVNLSAVARVQPIER